MPINIMITAVAFPFLIQVERKKANDPKKQMGNNNCLASRKGLIGYNNQEPIDANKVSNMKI